MLICKKIICAAAVLFCVTGLFAQSLDMPEMPTVSMPDMPTISSPTMDGKFYKPSVPQQKKTTTSSGTTTTTETKTSTETVLSDATTTEDLLLSLLTNSNLLTASDISGLYSSGSFDTLSSLTGLNGLSSYGYSTSTSDMATSLLLREILQKLNELKIEQNSASAAEQEVIAAKVQDSETFKTRNPSILRFKINNYSIKDSITQEFFSEPEPDGSFLLTADRKYFLNNKACTETFYLLFKAIKSNGSMTTFSVTPSIAQGTENKNSYVYKLCQLKDLTAEKTGNLVVVHYDDNGVAADLLLDIDK
ncbi:MAG: hypothetical protein J5687_02630 [Treponema sp.]|nr:hypothetical protein [Treponema sp.]